MKPNIFLVGKEELTVGIPIVFSSRRSALGKAEPFIRLSSDNPIKSLFLHRKHPPHTEFNSNNGGGRIATAGKIVHCKGRENVSGKKYAKNTSKNILMGLRHQEVSRSPVVIGISERQDSKKIRQFIELPCYSYHELEDRLVISSGKFLNISSSEMVVMSFQDTLSGELILFSIDFLEVFLRENKYLRKV